MTHPRRLSRGSRPQTPDPSPSRTPRRERGLLFGEVGGNQSRHVGDEQPDAPAGAELLGDRVKDIPGGLVISCPASMPCSLISAGWLGRTRCQRSGLALEEAAVRTDRHAGALGQVLGSALELWVVGDEHVLISHFGKSPCLELKASDVDRATGVGGGRGETAMQVLLGPSLGSDDLPRVARDLRDRLRRPLGRLRLQLPVSVRLHAQPAGGGVAASQRHASTKRRAARRSMASRILKLITVVPQIGTRQRSFENRYQCARTQLVELVWSRCAPLIGS